MKIKRYLLALSITLGTSIFLSSNAFAKDIKINRISGQDRFETNVKVSQNNWSESYYAVLVNGEDYPDSIVSSPLAYKFEAPILLINKDAIPQNTVNELKRLKVGKVFIIGGKGVISDSVESQLSSLGIGIEARVAGQDRFDTCTKIAHYIVGEKNSILVVNNEDYRSALAVSPVACQDQLPIYYSTNEGLPSQIKNNLNVEKHTSYIIGDKNNTNYIRNTTSSLGKFQVDLLEDNPTATNIEIYNTFQKELKFEKVFLVGSSGLADGLSISNLAGASASPIFFVDSSNISTIQNLLSQHKAEINDIEVIGGESLIPQTWLNSLEANVENYAPISANTIPDRNKPLEIDGDIRTQAEKDKYNQELQYWLYLQKHGLTMEQALNKVIQKTGNKNLINFYETTGTHFKIDNGKDITKRRFYRIHELGNDKEDYIVDEEDGTIYKLVKDNTFTPLQ